MKTTRFLLALFSAMAAATIASAQAVDFILVEKAAWYQQTGNTLPDVVAAPYNPSGPNPTGPYVFNVSVEGIGDLSSFTPPVFTKPGGSGPTPNLVQDGDVNRWEYRAFYTDVGSLDSAYNNGAYALTIQSTAVNLTLAGDFYPNKPMAILTGAGATSGSWSGSVFTYNTSQELTITSNIFDDYNGGAQTAYHLGFFIDGQSSVTNQEYFSTENPGDESATFTIAASSLAAGTYKVEIEFNTIVDTSSEYGEGQAVAIYTSRMFFTLNAVPEPSAYAAIFGALALAGAMIRRCRHQAA